MKKINFEMFFNSIYYFEKISFENGAISFKFSIFSFDYLKSSLFNNPATCFG